MILFDFLKKSLAVRKLVVSLYKKGTQTMKNIIIAIGMLILSINAKAQVYKFKKMYNFKHDAILETPFAVNNDYDTSLGSTATKKKTVLKINNKKIVWRLHSENKTYNYVVDSVDIVIPNMYVVYYTMSKEFNKQCVFYIINDGNKTLIYDRWKINQTQVQGWQAVIE